MTKLTDALKSRIDNFSWPQTAPFSLEEAWNLVEANPPPKERFVVRQAPALVSDLGAAEVRLGRILPYPIRKALLQHDGILETWTNSGPVLAGARELPDEWQRFLREWQAVQERINEGELSPEDWQGGLDPRKVELDRLFALGHDQSGHGYYLLDTGRVSAVGEFPVLVFDSEYPWLEQRWLSLGNFIAWIVCEAHCHPQRQAPPEMTRLFPRSC